MKLYETKFTPAGHETAVGRIYASSSSNASKQRTALKKRDKDADPSTEEIEVLQTREGILQLLNTSHGHAADGTLAQE